MKVIVRAIGDLREYFGREPQFMELSQDACVHDLLAEIELRYGAMLPGYLWDFQKHRFRGPVVLVVDKKAVQDFNTPLKEGLEITIMKAIAGGND
jgi:molybdopterin converting factor small subunit